MLWVIAVVLIVAWSLGLILHQSGLIHLLLLCAIAVIIVQLVAGRRAV
ncbi:MAG TPA: lmo0937 family membrane protein [Pyrinomonadaceae bacterium]|nr:lmo0937 family membrane protein [Pyrinomonadaceae bacterium]